MSTIKSLPHIHLPVYVAHILKPIKETGHQAYAKIQELGRRYFTKTFLKEKATNAVKAKILPLSQPPGLAVREKKIKLNIKKSDVLKVGFKKELHLLDKQISILETMGKLNSHDQQVLDNLHEQRSRKLQQYHMISGVKENAQRHLTHIRTLQFSQIGARFAGYVGMATNAIVPGASLPVGLALTGVSTVLQETSAQGLPEDSTTEEARKNVRLGTLSTLACTVISVAFTFFAMPTIKEFSWQVMQAAKSFIKN